MSISRLSLGLFAAWALLTAMTQPRGFGEPGWWPDFASITIPFLVGVIVIGVSLSAGLRVIGQVRWWTQLLGWCAAGFFLAVIFPLFTKELVSHSFVYDWLDQSNKLTWTVMAGMSGLLFWFVSFSEITDDK